MRGKASAFSAALTALNPQPGDFETEELRHVEPLFRGAPRNYGSGPTGLVAGVKTLQLIVVFGQIKLKLKVVFKRAFF